MPLALIDGIIFILVFWVFVTQMIIPILSGSRLFPAFSKKSLELVDEIKQVEQEIEAEHLRRKLELKKQQLAKEKETHA